MTMTTVIANVSMKKNGLIFATTRNIGVEERSLQKRKGVVGEKGGVGRGGDDGNQEKEQQEGGPEGLQIYSPHLNTDSGKVPLYPRALTQHSSV